VNVGSWLVWGFAATIVLTILLAGSQGLRLTRMNIPYLLGTMFTHERDRAKVYGILFHLVNGWIFSLVYVWAFHFWDGPTWWKGALIGIVHALFILVVALPALPGMHPRMAGDTHGPTAARQLESPGFFALHYGMQTPVSILLAHFVFGAILGRFYEP
jgi:uncharacterized membrane protein YagU involved in acid resistance